MVNKSISEVYSELSNIIGKTMSKVAHGVLFKTERGVVVYNKYVIVKTADGVDLYTRTGQEEIMSFNSAKTALIWSILDNSLQVSAARRVRELDTLLYSANFDVEVHKTYKKKTKTEDYLIYYSKYQHAKGRQKQFLLELDKYTILAQRCQSKGTKHEIK